MVLHCNGELDQARAVASAAPELSGSSLRRATAALSSISAPQAFDAEQGERQLAAITAELGVA
jgi:beta-N-acetylhexosaminidase